MRIKTNTTFTPSGRVRTKATVRVAPMLPALRASTTYDVAPSLAPTRRRKRRTKKKR